MVRRARPADGGTDPRAGLRHRPHHRAARAGRSSHRGSRLVRGDARTRRAARATRERRGALGRGRHARVLVRRSVRPHPHRVQLLPHADARRPLGLPRARPRASRTPRSLRGGSLPTGPRAHRWKGRRRRRRVGARRPRDGPGGAEALIEPRQRRRRDLPDVVRRDAARRDRPQDRRDHLAPLRLPARERASLHRGGLRDRVTPWRLRRQPRRSFVAKAADRRQAPRARERPRAAPRVTDLLLRGGTVIDGTGAPARMADVAIRDGRIVAVGPDLAADGARVIDAGGKAVAPGFIDIHSHSDEAMFVNDALESALHMGVTCVVCGNCGGSSAPVSGLAEAELDRELARLAVKRTWSSFAEYASAVDRARPAINVCSFVGHGTLRSCVMGAEDRAPTADELRRMRALLATSMDEGAIGMASGLIYPPSAFGTTDELASLCAVVREKGGLYASHIRNESSRLLDAVEENLEIGRRSRVRVELSHHKAAGQSNWGRVRESTTLIEGARAA